LRYAAWRLAGRPATLGGAERAVRLSVIDLVDSPTT
jgi:hypothetical protein